MYSTRVSWGLVDHAALRRCGLLVCCTLNRLVLVQPAGIAPRLTHVVQGPEKSALPAQVPAGTSLSNAIHIGGRQLPTNQKKNYVSWMSRSLL